MQIKIEEVPFGSEKYQALVELRYELLRKPLGLKVSSDDVAPDPKEFHIAALEDDQAVGCVLLRPLDTMSIKLRQMAVGEAFRRRGIGAKLVQFAEDLAASRGFGIMEMHARKSAQAFYEKLGYSAEGEEFLEVTVPHIKMRKRLCAKAT